MIANGQVLTSIETNSNRKGSFTFSPNSDLLVTVSGEEVIFWPVASSFLSPEPLFSYELAGESSSKVAYSPDGRFIAVATNSGDIKILGVLTGEN